MSIEVRYFAPDLRAADIRELLLDIHDEVYAVSSDAFDSRERFARFVKPLLGALCKGEPGQSVDVGPAGRQGLGGLFSQVVVVGEDDDLKTLSHLVKNPEPGSGALFFEGHEHIVEGDRQLPAAVRVALQRRQAQRQVELVAGALAEFVNRQRGAT